MSDDLLRRLGKLAEKRGVGIIDPLAAGHRQQLELLSLNQPTHGSVWRHHQLEPILSQLIPRALGLPSQEDNTSTGGYAGGGGAWAAITIEAVAPAPDAFVAGASALISVGACPSAGAARAGKGAWPEKNVSCKTITPKTAAQTTIASADANFAKRISDLWGGEWRLGRRCCSSLIGSTKRSTCPTASSCSPAGRARSRNHPGGERPRRLKVKREPRFHAIEDRIWGLIEEATERNRRTVDRSEGIPNP
jgi:hypothetical protein